MPREVITDNSVEKLEYVEGDDKYSLVQTAKGQFPDIPNRRVIILNPKEAEVVADLIKASLSTLRQSALDKRWWSW